MKFRRNPLVYEINTCAWLNELSRRYKRPITLDTVPDETLDALASWHLDAIWMMGIWERSPRGREIALRHPDLQNEYRRVLPNLAPEHVVGSPYAVHRYAVDPRYGGREALAHFRARLAQRGMGLILDYVPNHVAVDHPWTQEAPTALVRASAADLRRDGMFFSVITPQGEERYFAHGRDPYFPAWTDTAQIDAFSREARRLTIDTLLDIAGQCDGVRCDMVMLLVNRIFAQTWGRGDLPQTEFWAEVIPAVRARHPQFLFIAEVYWGMEAELQALGFDYTYDKTLYDRLLHESTPKIRDHLMASMAYQRRMVRFVENHDEARALTAFGPQKSRAAATIALTLPGMALLHDGQFEGRRLRVPVQLGVLPDETPVEALTAFYRALLAEANDAPYHDGVFMMLAAHPMPNEGGAENLLAYAWALGDDWRIVAANFSDQHARGRIMLPRPALAGGTWRFKNILESDGVVERGGDDVLTGGLPVALDAHSVQIIRISQV